MSEKYDIAVIGSGPGGYVAAIRASQLGKKVCIIEKYKPGGVCLNLGCIPSKSLIHHAGLYGSVSELEALGLTVDRSGFDYSRVFSKSRKAAEILSKGVLYLCKKNNIDYIEGTAFIKTPNHIDINGKPSIRTSNIIIATGSRPRELNGFRFDGRFILSSDHMLMQDKLPERIIILGAGPIGVEFSYVLSSFGVKVFLVELLDNILPNTDPDCTAVIVSSLKRKNVDIYTGTKAQSFHLEKNGIRVQLNGPVNELEADQLLVVTGRTPNTDNIGLENLGLTTTNGFITIHDYYQTDLNGVFAIGDVISSQMLAHAASKEGEIAAEYIAGLKPETQLDQDLIPYAVYTCPGTAGFGHTEQSATHSGLSIKTFSFPFRADGKAVAMEKKDGFVKIICDSGNRKIIGCHIAGEQSSELIHEILLAAKTGLFPSDVAHMVHAHPSLSEAIMEAMRGIEGRAIHI
ncbi:MAG: dihydrolipoyl dehydrogenase [Spirochaetales bacterium]|nr:dihydrolipoyl dehydrogenase [Spirochaetales bacterium]